MGALAPEEEIMTELPKRQLGRTGLQVTVLGYGTMELRGGTRGRPVSEKEADTILNSVLDAGINYIDTSIDYGVSEERICRAISHRRSEYFLASKCGCLAGLQPEGAGREFPHVFTAENVIAGVNQSLARMKTDYLDLVQFHHTPSKAEIEEQGGLQALQDLQKQGKIRFIGMSGTIPNLSEHIEMGVFDVFQIPYSALQREHEELIGKASDSGAGIVIRGGVARGGPLKEDGKLWDIWQKAGLDDLLGGMTRMEFTFRFTISNPHLDTTIVGTLNLGHMRENLVSLRKGPLAPDVIAEAKRRLAAAGSGPTMDRP
jgi:aryl-alcohol dehydrogenase-like predicted oxidoreductase